MDCVQSNYLRKQPSHTDICAYTERMAGEAGDVEVPPQPAAGQHCPTRSNIVRTPFGHQPGGVLCYALEMLVLVKHGRDTGIWEAVHSTDQFLAGSLGDSPSCPMCRLDR